MILTPRFVFLSFPKTGSTFVREILRELAERRGGEIEQSLNTRKIWKVHHLLWMTHLRRPAGIELHTHKSWWPSHPPDQHGTLSQIPWAFRRLPVVGVVRNPLDRYVSQFHFQWYAKQAAAPVEEVQERLPTFPDLTFEEYLDYVREFQCPTFQGEAILARPDVGYQTVSFIRMFFPNPEQVLQRLNTDFIRSGAFKKYLPSRLQLLQMERLNDDLADFLLATGYEKSEVEFIRAQGEIQPPEGTCRKAGDNWRLHYTPQSYERVVYEERFLIEMLKALGFDYGMT